MKKKDVAKTGMSLYGSVKNRRDHNRFTDAIEELESRNRFNRMNLGSLRISFGNYVSEFNKLKRYTISNMNTLFEQISIIKKKSTSYEKMIKNQQSEIEDLKSRIIALEKKI